MQQQQPCHSYSLLHAAPSPPTARRAKGKPFADLFYNLHAFLLSWCPTVVEPVESNFSRRSSSIDSRSYSFSAAGGVTAAVPSSGAGDAAPGGGAAAAMASLASDDDAGSAASGTDESGSEQQRQRAGSGVAGGKHPRRLTKPRLWLLQADGVTDSSSGGDTQSTGSGADTEQSEAADAVSELPRDPSGLYMRVAFAPPARVARGSALANAVAELSQGGGGDGSGGDGSGFPADLFAPASEGGTEEAAEEAAEAEAAARLGREVKMMFGFYTG